MGRPADRTMLLNMEDSIYGYEEKACNRHEGYPAC